MAAPSSSRLGSCGGCPKPARYTCPACAFLSCSLACSQQHKLATECTGVAPPVWSLPLQANQLGWGELMRDQSYISSVGRKVEETGRQLVGDKLIPANSHGEESRLDGKSEKETLLCTHARQEGVNLVLLPKGMSRRARNGTRWDQKQSHLEWTTEVTFQPFPHLKGPSAAAPQSFTTMPHSSSATLHAVLTSAMTMRDKKGKGKEAACTPEETKWREREKKWLRGVAPDEEEPKEEVAAGKAEGEAPFECAAPSTTTPAPDAVAEDVDAEEEDDEAEPPFLLLLAVYTPPPASSPSTASDEPSNPNLVQASSASSTTTAATTSSSCKKFHLLPSLALTLRSALQYTTLLEYPSFELWSREAFLRARLMGKLEVVDKPRELPVDLHAAGGGGGWERGRGRGRGRGADRGTRGSGRGRGGGRGGSAGAGGGRGEWSQREEEVPVEQRVSDAGWGKRALAPATDAGASAGDFEIEIELDMGAGDEGGREEKRRRTEPQQDVELPTGLSGLVGYESD